MTRKFFAALFVFFLLTACVPRAYAADKSEAQYQKIKAELKSLMSSEARKGYRHNWLRIIDKFQQFQSRYPKSKYAAESLHAAAGAYAGLYEYSYLKDDLEGALKLYDKMLDLYPASNLADDALVNEGEILEQLGKNSEAYVKYDQCLSDYPKGDRKVKAASGKKRLAKFAPKKIAAKDHGKKPKADQGAAPIPEPTPVTAGTQDTIPPPTPVSEGPLEPIPAQTAGGQPVLRKIEHWSTPDYTRIVIEVSDKVEFEPHLLEKEPNSNLPRRLFIDFKKCVMAPELAAEVPIEDGLLKRARVGQNTDDVVRVVLDIKSITDFQIFPIFEPYRIVIDVMGEKKPAPPPQTGPAKTWTVVLDAGHGGGDPGAMSRKGDRESAFVLSIAKKVEALLKNEPRLKVIMTRSTDVFIPLPGRTAIANKADADLFVSIHINAASNRDAYGLELYHFAPRAQREDLDLVAAENATAPEQVNDLNSILTALDLSYKKVESNTLATMVRDGMLGSIGKQNADAAVCRKVRSAPFYVLMGARMPAILVECGFITNKMELARLKNAKYQDALAKGIADGIRAYFAGYN